MSTDDAYAQMRERVAAEKRAEAEAAALREAADALDREAAALDVDPRDLALAARRGSNYGLTTRLRAPRPVRDPHADETPSDDPGELARRARRRRGY